MKKSLLTLCCSIFIGATSAAGMPLSLNQGKLLNSLIPVNSSVCLTNHKAHSNSLIKKAPTKSDSELWMNWGYCSDPYNAFSMPAGELKGAIMVTKTICKKYDGAEISAVQIANPTNTSYENPLAGSSFKVWISNELDGEPICSGTGIFGPEGFEYSSAQLDEPYTLKKDTPVYIGFTFDVPSSNQNQIFSVITDYMQPENEHSAYLYSTFTGFDNNGNMTFDDECKWRAVGNFIGNLCITITISGDMLPKDQVSIVDSLIPAVVKPNKEFDFTFITYNSGANEIDNIDLTFEIEGQEPQVKRAELYYGPISYNQSSLDTVSFVCDKVSSYIPYKISISAVNGNPVENVYSKTGNLTCIDKGFKRNVVFEEGTGTWCGWCVVGYAGMEYMKENYSDKGFIGIAVHSGDEMEVMNRGCAYASFASHYESFPSAFMDRNWGYNIYPQGAELEYEFLNMVAFPAYAYISAELTINPDDDRKVSIKTNTKFAASEENADFGIAYTVVEDGVGPYIQTNYASGMPDDYDGFENMGEQVELTFNDVARNCSHPAPIENSLPTAIEADTEYEFSTDIELTDVNDLTKYRIVAMVIDRRSGMIQNACQVSPSSPSGVNEITDNASALRVKAFKGELNIISDVPANIYSTDGRIVAAKATGKVALPSGLYIVSTGAETVKVIVR